MKGVVDPRIEEQWERLDLAIKTGCSIKTCLRYWSQFIRVRDLYLCVRCNSGVRVSAHHIFRKTFLPEAKLLTGNGITLCHECHRGLHLGFNKKPDLNLPMDAQDGEKIESIAELFGILLDGATQRGIFVEKYYFLSESILGAFKTFQGFHPQASFPGGPVEQAALIWNQCPLSVRNAFLRGFGLAEELEPILPGGEVRRYVLPLRQTCS